MSRSDYVPRGYQVTPRSRAKIRETAEFARFVCGLGDETRFDVDIILEHRLGPVGLHWDIVDKRELGDDQEARAIPDAGVLLVREDIHAQWTDETSWGARARFTFAHELGHLFMHTGVPFHRTQEKRTSHPPFEDSEWQADTFAAEFLMPVRLVNAHCRSAAEIVREFGVSRQAARIRVANLREDNLLEW